MSLRLIILVEIDVTFHYACLPQWDVKKNVVEHIITIQHIKLIEKYII